MGKRRGESKGKESTKNARRVQRQSYKIVHAKTLFKYQGKTDSIIGSQRQPEVLYLTDQLHWHIMIYTPVC